MHQQHRYHFRVPFADVDHAGIVYYPRLFHYFHLAYEDFFHSALGFPFQEWFEGSAPLAAPITRAEARFLSPLRHGDAVRAETWIRAIGRDGWEWATELWVGDRLCAQGMVRHAFVHIDTMQRAELPAEWSARVAPWVAGDAKPENLS